LPETMTSLSNLPARMAAITASISMTNQSWTIGPQLKRLLVTQHSRWTQRRIKWCSSSTAGLSGWEENFGWESCDTAAWLTRKRRSSLRKPTWCALQLDSIQRLKAKARTEPFACLPDKTSCLGKSRRQTRTQSLSLLREVV